MTTKLSKDRATPRPWNCINWVVYDSKNNVITECFGEVKGASVSEAESNASLIVRAVNNFELFLGTFLQIQRDIDICQEGLEEACLDLIVSRIEKVLKQANAEK